MLVGLQTPSSASEKSSLFSSSHLAQAVVGTLAISIPFIWFVFTNQNRLVPFASDTPATYYLVDPLIIMLIIIPTVMGWLIGLLVAFKASDSLSLVAETREVDFFNGIFLVVLGSIILQALISIGTARLYALGLGVILLLIYVFIAVQLVGYILLVRNTRRFLD